MGRMVLPLLCLLATVGAAQAQQADSGGLAASDTPAEEHSEMPGGTFWTNSIGMVFARIEPGSFMMGNDQPLPAELTHDYPHRAKGDFDERPVHEVAITRPFYMGVFEATNAQFELFDPGHASLRGKQGFSREDDEAVVFVDWAAAVAFCNWLSEKEGRPYRLPTEAEWEYACRAGTTTAFSTGDVLPAACLKNARETWYPDPNRVEEGRAFDDDVVSLKVGITPPNPWGLCDMHGNVEEWCLDWYGPYPEASQTDPVGYASGEFRVTRGGSHSTEPYFLRSANRLGTIPEDASWLIGFRVVLGEMPGTSPLTPPRLPLHQRDVVQRASAGEHEEGDRSFCEGPRQYVKIPPDSWGPLFSEHNHDPGLVECPNGDLLAVWYTCHHEQGRELGLVASRLRCGADEWEPAAPFWDVPDRNDHAPALWSDGGQTLYHFVGLSAAATWGNLAVVMRTSNDSGASWSPARLIAPEHTVRHQPVESVLRTSAGAIIVPCDAVSTGAGGTALLISQDGGKTWADPGGRAAGIHAGVVELTDGRLMALGRGDDIDGKMPKSVSKDLGKTWTYEASVFPPIGGGQRLVLMRLSEGPLFFASFAEAMTMTDGAGGQSVCSGLFAALSYDDGETWPVRRLVTPGGPRRQVERMDGLLFELSDTTAEPAGYLSACQGRDRTVHLITSRQHYAFNRAWIENE
jgi:formylglycine-generating enzyme